jgi:hypothetical protein
MLITRRIPFDTQLERQLISPSWKVMREILHPYTITADVSLCTVTIIPLQPLSPSNSEYNKHFASESGRVSRITTSIRMIRKTEQPEGNTGEFACLVGEGGGKRGVYNWREIRELRVLAS